MEYYQPRDNFFSRIPTVTRNLFYVNVVFFIATLINEKFMMSSFALFYPTSHYFHWWQLFTHMFMHGGWAHIFFNMWALIMFGSAVEQTIGSKKMLWLYFVAGLGAVALHFGVMHLECNILENQIMSGVAGAAESYARLKATPTVGASGAIYGLLMSYALLYPQRRLTLIFPPISMKAMTWIIVFAVIELFLGVKGVADGVAHFAHLGGMLFGWLMIRYWRKKGTLFNEYGQY